MSAAERIPVPPRRLTEVSVDQAAPLLGLSPSQVRRRAQELQDRGLAKKVGHKWAIHGVSDPRLQKIETWDERDLSQLAVLRSEGVKPGMIAVAEARRETLRLWAAFDRGQDKPKIAAGVFMARLRVDRPELANKIGSACYSTLQGWQAAYREPGELGGIRALVPGWGKTRGIDPIGVRAWEAIAEARLDGNARSIRSIYVHLVGFIRGAKLEGDPDWKLPAYETILREVRRRIPKPLKILADKGPRAFDAQCVSKGARDYESIAAGDVWVGDERVLDFQVRIRTDRGWKLVRPKLTLFRDMRSRLPVGWVVALHADHNTILGAIKNGIRRHGKPRELLVDWGKDFRKAAGHAHTRRFDLDSFDETRVKNVLEKLGMKVKAATPYMPQAKPIERDFGSMKGHLDRLYPGFRGGSPSERHEDRERWCRENFHLIPTLDQVEQVIDQYFEVYARTPLNGEGMFGLAPAEAMEKFRDGPVRAVADDVLEFLFLSFTEPKIVRRDGVRHLKSWYGWGEPRLMALQGQKVVLGIHPDDAGTAWVCDIEQRPLFRVESERHRFRTKRDAERIAKVRGSAKKLYRDQVRDARAALLSSSPSEMLQRRSDGIEAIYGRRTGTDAVVRRLPRIVQVDPALSNAIQNAAEKPLEGPLAEAQSDDQCVSLDDMSDDDYDPFAAERERREKDQQAAEDAKRAEYEELFSEDDA